MARFSTVMGSMGSVGWRSTKRIRGSSGSWDDHNKKNTVIYIYILFIGAFLHAWSVSSHYTENGNNVLVDNVQREMLIISILFRTYCLFYRTHRGGGKCNTTGGKRLNWGALSSRTRTLTLTLS